MTQGPIRTTIAATLLLLATTASGQDRGQALFEELKRPVPPAVELGDDPKPADLAKARHRAAAVIYNATLRRILEPSSGGVGGLDFDAGERLTRWAERCVQAQVDGLDGDDDRRKALDDEAAYIRKLEAALRPIADRPATAIGAIDLTKLEFYRLELLTRRTLIRGK